MLVVQCNFALENCNKCSLTIVSPFQFDVCAYVFDIIYHLVGKVIDDGTSNMIPVGTRFTLFPVKYLGVWLA